MGHMGNMMVEDGSGNEALCPCRHCGRKFRWEALQKHEKICVKVFQKERKKFNVQEQRLPEEALKLQHEAKRAQRYNGTRRQGNRGSAQKLAPENKIPSNWRLKSEAFRRAIKESRVVTKFQQEGRSLKDLPPPQAPPPELDDRVPCPHCGRRFGQQQAERHIPKCKDIKAKPTGILRAHAAAPAPPKPVGTRQRRP